MITNKIKILKKRLDIAKKIKVKNCKTHITNKQTF